MTPLYPIKVEVSFVTYSSHTPLVRSDWLCCCCSRKYVHGRISNSSTLSAINFHRSLYTKGGINFVSVPKWSSESECGA